MDLKIARKIKPLPESNYLHKDKKDNIQSPKRAEESDIKNPFNIPKRLRLFTHKRSTIKRRPETFITSDPKTICDLDSTFYKIIEGRPLRQFIDVKVYMSNIRDITLFRANAAYLKEQIIQINTSLSDEHRQYNKIDQYYARTKSIFIGFIKENYNTAKSVQDQALTVSQTLNNTIDKLSALSFTYVRLRNEIDNLVAVFENLAKYYYFINSISPLWWRESYDKDFDENKFLFSQIFKNSGTRSAAVLDLYKSSAGLFNKMTPKIYFRKPYQIIRIFDSVSKQCLNYMQIEDYSACITKPVINSRDYLKTLLLEEIEEVNDLILFYETETKWMEQQEIDYKTKFNRILFADFQNLFSSYESSHLFTCIQYVHTQLFGGPEDPKDDILNLAYNIENLYIQLTLKLDGLNQELVNIVKRDLFKEDIKKMKRAHKAQRSLRECDILKKSLITSFEPPRHKK